MNPGWSFWLWTDEDNRRLIAEHYPQFLAMYDGYDLPIKRIDAARIFYLHRFGGIYMDLDFACLRPFDALTAPWNDAIFSYQYPSRFHPGAIANNFMAGPPQHPFWSHAIHGLTTQAHRPLLMAAGPNFITNWIALYQKQLEKRGVPDDHITVYKMPTIYSAGWRAGNKNPCGDGTRQELARCRREGTANTSILATFWTMTWKGTNLSQPTPGAQESGQYRAKYSKQSSRTM